MVQIREIIFDFDGLIIDTESAAFAAWSEIYRRYNQTLELRKWVACVGASDEHFDSVRHLEQLSGQSLDRNALLAKKDQAKAAICDTLDPRPGVLDRLREARDLGLKIALASSSGFSWVDGHLRRIKLRDEFDAILTRENVHKVKPYPDLYLGAARALDLEPHLCVTFEDSRNGVLAAKAAGMRCFAVPNPITKDLDFSAADGVLQSLAAVTIGELLAQFSG